MPAASLMDGKEQRAFISGERSDNEKGQRVEGISCFSVVERSRDHPNSWAKGEELMATANSYLLLINKYSTKIKSIMVNALPMIVLSSMCPISARRKDSRV